MIKQQFNNNNYMQNKFQCIYKLLCINIIQVQCNVIENILNLIIPANFYPGFKNHKVEQQ